MDERLGSARSPSLGHERRLETILRALPGKELDALADRIEVSVDPNKRIDKCSQVARALVRRSDIREPARLPLESANLLRRIAEAGGSLVVGALPGGLELLVRRGIVYARIADEEVANAFRERHGARPGGHVIELVLPTAFLVQLRASEGDDPRSLRALLAEAPVETATAIATHYLGRPSTPPVALSLEPAWEVLGNHGSLAAELARLSHQERRLLDQLEQVGGEVDTQELMDLEREPMRLRGAYGVAAGRRGAAFSLEKRGFLFPLHPNRYVLPTEVAVLVGAERSRERERRRASIRSDVLEEDHLPRRAHFAVDPIPYVLALAMAGRDAAVVGECRAGTGTPRSLVARLAQRIGRTPEQTALLIALSKALGLWDPAALSSAAPPGTMTLAELPRALFDVWRRGGAWDEARGDAEMVRLPAEARDASPIGVLRDVVLDALTDLGEGQWTTYGQVVGYLSEDPRMGGLRRLFERWAKRVGLTTPEPLSVVRRVLLESLPALGLVDIGGEGGEAISAPGLDAMAIRLGGRGRTLAAANGVEVAQPSVAPRAVSSVMEERRLRVGNSARIADVLDVTAFVDVVSLEPTFELELSSAAIGRGLAGGIQADEMLRRLAVLAVVPEAVVTLLHEAGTVVGSGTFAPASGFLWVDEPEVRELLRTSGALAEMFVEPSPPGGLLLAPGVDVDRVVRRCRALGVEVAVEEARPRARRSTAPPPRAVDANRKTVSWRPPSVGAPPDVDSSD